MRTLFADTCDWIALLNPRDQLHDRAVRVSQSLLAARIVTTDEMLTELLNDFGDRGILLRQAATRMVAQMQVDSRIHIEPQSRETFEAGFRVFRAPDPDAPARSPHQPRASQTSGTGLQTPSRIEVGPGLAKPLTIPAPKCSNAPPIRR